MCHTSWSPTVKENGPNSPYASPSWEAGRLCRGETLLQPCWATTTFVDFVPFLKVSWWLLPVLSQTPGENPRSSDRAVAALCRRSLLEDDTLEFTMCGSRRSCGGDGGASSDSVGSSWCFLRQSFHLVLQPGVSCLVSLVEAFCLLGRPVLVWWCSPML